MSTPLLSRHHFAAIRDSLIYHATNDWSPRSCSCVNGELLRVFNLHFEPGTPEQASAAIAALVFDLQRMNAAAYDTRYGKENAPEARLVKPLSARKGTLLSLPATLKALRCVRCNCDGGSVGNALETLGKLINALEDAVIDAVPEYRATEWFL